MKNNTIKEAINQLMRLNRIIELTVKDERTTLKCEARYLNKPYEGQANALNNQTMMHAFTDMEGKIPYSIHSDIFAMDEKTIYLKGLSCQTMIDIFRNIVKQSLPYLEYMAKETSESILIQSFTDPKAPSLTIAAGLSNDLQVIVLNIRRQSKEEE